MSRRVAVTGDHLADVVAVLEKHDFEVVQTAPDLVFCSGGDGTFLRSERIWPGVPKVPARVSARADLCPQHRLEAVISRMAAGTLVSETLPKISVQIGKWRMLALNDVVLRNAVPTVAMRFAVHGEARKSREITGDGLVVCTPFGSSAYYKSITGRTIREGLGIAYNNCTEAREPEQVAPGVALEVHILRGPAILVADNDPRSTLLRAGHSFVVTGSEEGAVGWGLDALRCQTCRRMDGSCFNPHQSSLNPTHAGAASDTYQSK